MVRRAQYNGTRFFSLIPGIIIGVPCHQSHVWALGNSASITVDHLIPFGRFIPFSWPMFPCSMKILKDCFLGREIKLVPLAVTNELFYFIAVSWTGQWSNFRTNCPISRIQMALDGRFMYPNHFSSSDLRSNMTQRNQFQHSPNSMY